MNSFDEYNSYLFFEGKLNKAYDALSEHITGMNEVRNKIGKKIGKESVEVIDVVEEVEKVVEVINKW